MADAPGGPALPPQPVTHVSLKCLALSAASAFVAVNLWTGAPIAALWVGSAVVGQRELSMSAVFVVVLALAVVEGGLGFVLIRINAAHDRLTGRPKGEQRAAWLQSMNTQGQAQQTAGVATSSPERIVVVTVYVAVIALLVWFFLFAGSPLPG